MLWIRCIDQMPPKEYKFLFSYFYGIGIGEWGQSYGIINGNSERMDNRYILILHPAEINDGINPFQWNEEYMVEMEVSWMPLPEPPKG